MKNKKRHIQRKRKRTWKKPTAFLVVGVDCVKSREINFFLSTLNAHKYNRTLTKNVQAINQSDSREKNELNEEYCSWGSSKWMFPYGTISLRRQWHLPNISQVLHWTYFCVKRIHTHICRNFWGLKFVRAGIVRGSVSGFLSQKQKLPPLTPSAT